MNLFKKIKPFLLLIILLGFTIYLLGATIFSNVTLQQSHYSGIILTIIITVSFFFKPPIGNLVLGLMLLMGTVIKASFTPTVQSFWIKFGIKIEFSWHYLLLFLLYLILNYKELPGWVKKVSERKKCLN